MHIILAVTINDEVRQALNIWVKNLEVFDDFGQVVFDLQNIEILFTLHYDAGDR